MMVLNIRLNSRGVDSVPRSLASGPSTFVNSGTVVKDTSGPSHLQIGGVLAAQVEKLEGLLLGFLQTLLEQYAT